MKFRINDEVVVKATGEKGVVVSRDNYFDNDTMRSSVSYVVKLGEKLKDFKEFTRKELKRVTKEETVYPKNQYKVYKAPNGYLLTMVGVTNIVSVPSEALVTVDDNNDDEPFDGYNVESFEKMSFTFKCKTLNIGFAIYNPEDDYDINRGIKIARHRAMHSPFCSLTARFLGEFNVETVDALLDVKANYIINNFERFVNTSYED